MPTKKKEDEDNIVDLIQLGVGIATEKMREDPELIIGTLGKVATGALAGAMESAGDELRKTIDRDDQTSEGKMMSIFKGIVAGAMEAGADEIRNTTNEGEFHGRAKMTIGEAEDSDDDGEIPIDGS